MNWDVSTIYLVIIGLEVCITNFQHRKVYTLRETATTVFLSIVNGLLDLAIRGFYLLMLTLVFQYRLFEIYNPIAYWIILFLLVDFQFYWLHSLEHYCRVFWAAHVTHHSAEHMNITVGFRASLMRPLYDFLFFLPLPLFGFRPIEILLMYSFAQIWAVFVHTEVVRKMGWLEYVFVTPSHHRVHHASNARYIDRNMGMVLIVWDRMFGTFQKELSEDEYEPIRYGLTKPLQSHNLFHVMFHEWISMWKDVRQKGLGWKERLRYVFGPPGWQHERKA